jgi:hypothetical protein
VDWTRGRPDQPHHPPEQERPVGVGGSAGGRERGRPPGPRRRSQSHG